MRRTNQEKTALTDAESLIEAALSQAGDPGQVLHLNGEPANAAAIFDALAGFAGPGAQRHYESRFEVIAPPGDLVVAQIIPDDMVLGRAYGEGSIAWADTVAWGD